MSYVIEQVVPVLVGQGAVNELAAKLRQEFSATKVALVTDPGVKGAGIADKVAAALEEGNLPVAVFYDKVERDAPDYNVDELADLICKHGCDAVVAVAAVPRWTPARVPRSWPATADRSATT